MQPNPGRCQTYLGAGEAGPGVLVRAEEELRGDEDRDLRRAEAFSSLVAVSDL